MAFAILARFLVRSNEATITEWSERDATATTNGDGAEKEGIDGQSERRARRRSLNLSRSALPLSFFTSHPPLLSPVAHDPLLSLHQGLTNLKMILQADFCPFCVLIITHKVGKLRLCTYDAGNAAAFRPCVQVSKLLSPVVCVCILEVDFAAPLLIEKRACARSRTYEYIRVDGAHHCRVLRSPPRRAALRFSLCIAMI